MERHTWGPQRLNDLRKQHTWDEFLQSASVSTAKNAHKLLHQPTIPPFLFAMSQDSPKNEFVYRGAYPTLKNFRFLSDLNLKCMISLIPEKPTKDLTDFCNSNERNIKLKHFKVPVWNEEVKITKEIICKVLGKIVNKRNLPVYIHCVDGRHYSSLVIACLRVLQHWHQSSIRNEYETFLEQPIAKGLSSLTEEEKKFVLHFQGPITIPDSVNDLPSWLFPGLPRDFKLSELKHPVVKLKLKSKRKRKQETFKRSIQELCLFEKLHIDSGKQYFSRLDNIIYTLTLECDDKHNPDVNSLKEILESD